MHLQLVAAAGRAGAQRVDALGSCTFNTGTEALSNALDEAKWASLPATLNVGQTTLTYTDTKTAEECALEDGNMPFADRLHPLADKMMEELRTYWFVLKDTDPQSTIIFKEYEGPSVSPLNRQISR